MPCLGKRSALSPSKSSRLRSLRSALIAAIAVASIGAGFRALAADDYPARPIRVLIGPSSEVAVRLVADRLLPRIGQPLVVESRPGAGGEVAAKAVAAADPDGYTLLYGTSAYTLNTALGLAGYDLINEFEPIAQFGLTPFSLVVHPSVPAKNVQELIAWAKTKPGEVNCASSGFGTPPHLGCEILNALAGVKVVHVPFRNVNAAVNGLLSGDVHMLFAVSSNAQPQIDGGTLRGLAVTTPKTTSIAPGLPTMDATIPGFIMVGWGSLMAPAKTPKPIIDKLSREVVTALRDPELLATFGKRTGMDPTDNDTPEKFRAFIKEDIDRWNKLIDKAGVQRGKR